MAQVDRTPDGVGGRAGFPLLLAANVGLVLVMAVSPVSAATDPKAPDPGLVARDGPPAQDGALAGSTLAEIEREDGSPVQCHVMIPDTLSTYPLVLYLTGSSCQPVAQELPYLRPLVQAGYAVLAPEKRGVRPRDGGKPCSNEFLLTNDRHQRLADAGRVLTSASRLVTRWNGGLIIVGASEGASIAPEIAARHPSTAALALLGAGGWSQAEELERIREKELRRQGKTAGEVRDDLRALDMKFDEIRRAPTAAKHWLGETNTYKRWASYLDYSPLAFLVKVTCPVFLATGTEDTSVPVESADAVFQEFQRLGKDALRYKRYEGLDHRWVDRRGESQFKTVGADLVTWLNRIMARR